MRFLLFLPAGDREHALALAETVREDDRAAHHLIGVLGIDAEPQRQLHGLVELRELDFLHERNRVLDRITPIGSDLRLGSGELLTAFFLMDLPWFKRAQRASHFYFALGPHPQRPRLALLHASALVAATPRLPAAC